MVRSVLQTPVASISVTKMGTRALEAMLIDGLLVLSGNDKVEF